jgi:Delta3,5-Delta2,4-dienoyl-CoA isomerase
VNAFSNEFWENFGETFDKIGLEPDVRAVILASALPKLFSGGIDCKSSSLDLVDIL